MNLKKYKKNVDLSKPWERYFISPQAEEDGYYRICKSGCIMEDDDDGEHCSSTDVLFGLFNNNKEAVEVAVKEFGPAKFCKDYEPDN